MRLLIFKTKQCISKNDYFEEMKVFPMKDAFSYDFDTLEYPRNTIVNVNGSCDVNLFRLNQEIIDWLNDNRIDFKVHAVCHSEEDMNHCNGVFWYIDFLNDNDAMLFKLTWL